MIKRVLIANRGEIALRIQRTCRELGIETVAVYSDPDRNALHVRNADFAVRIGPGPALESYLVIDRIIEAARQTGADAIHPGYGFLSENARFVDACEEAGITFIGPTADAMRALGGKVSARRLMEAAGVPIVPGANDISADDFATAEREAARIGFPLMVKASAGGGGRGIRLVERPEDLQAAMRACAGRTAGSSGCRPRRSSGSSGSNAGPLIGQPGFPAPAKSKGANRLRALFAFLPKPHSIRWRGRPPDRDARPCGPEQSRRSDRSRLRSRTPKSSEAL